MLVAQSLSYCDSILGNFGAWWPAMLGHLAFQEAPLRLSASLSLSLRKLTSIYTYISVYIYYVYLHSYMYNFYTYTDTCTAARRNSELRA